MRNRLMLPMGLVMLIVGSTAPVSAQVAPPPPPPQTGPGFAEYYLPGSDSFHFRTVEGLGGYGFKEGEQVTVTAVPPVIPPATVTAARYGIFNVRITFRWVFCGPRATVQPRPTFTATGNEGDVASTHPLPEHCPMLSSSPAGNIRPPVDVGSLAFSVQAFGFVPGEKVTVREEQAGPYGSGPAAQVVADTMGRIRTQIRAYIPQPCPPWDPYPTVMSVGDRGTSSAWPLNWFDPREVSCPGRVPSRAPPVIGPYRGVGLSLRLTPAQVRAGRIERATVEVAGASTQATLIVSYQGNRRLMQTLQDTRTGYYRFRWQVPRDIRAGTAHVVVDIEPWKAGIRGVFEVR